MARERTEKGVPCLSVTGLRSSKADTVPVALWLLLLLLLPLLLLLLLPMPLLLLLLPSATLLFWLRLMNLRVGLDKGGGRGGHEEATRRTAAGMLLPSRKRIILKLRDRSDAPRRSRGGPAIMIRNRRLSFDKFRRGPGTNTLMSQIILHFGGDGTGKPGWGA